MTETEQREFIERQLRQSFDMSIAAQVDRHMRGRLHPIIGDEFFSAASTECRDTFVHGDFYGCITLCQAVAEGLARFVAERNHMRAPGEFAENVATLHRRNLIHDDVRDAFLATHGRDRNDFHHLNKDVEQDRRILETRAEECLRNLYVVESEIFGCETIAGRMQPKLPKYWNFTSDGSVGAFVRFA